MEMIRWCRSPPLCNGYATSHPSACTEVGGKTHHDHVEIDRIMEAGVQLDSVQISNILCQRLLFPDYIVDLSTQQGLLDHFESHAAAGDVVLCFEHRSRRSRTDVFDDGELVNADLDLGAG